MGFSIQFAISVTTIALSASTSLAQQAYYACIFGPDSTGVFHEEVVPESVAQGCNMFCVCQELKPTCLIGPNSDCNYVTIEVDRQYAETCNRDQCICTIHDDYIITANARMNDFSLCPVEPAWPLDGKPDVSEEASSETQETTSNATSNTASEEGGEQNDDGSVDAQETVDVPTEASDGQAAEAEVESSQSPSDAQATEGSDQSQEPAGGSESGTNSTNEEVQSEEGNEVGAEETQNEVSETDQTEAKSNQDTEAEPSEADKTTDTEEEAVPDSESAQTESEQTDQAQPREDTVATVDQNTPESISTATVELSEIRPEKPETAQPDRVSVLTFNGRSITDGAEQVTCRFGPDAITGEYVETSISVQSYELICNGADQGFCDCDVDNSLTDRQVQAIQAVILEMINSYEPPEVTQPQETQVVETKTIIIEEPVEKRIVKEGTNPVTFFLIGAGLVLLAIALVLIVVMLVVRKRKSLPVDSAESSQTRIVNQTDNMSQSIPGIPVVEGVAIGQHAGIVLQDFDVEEQQDVSLAARKDLGTSGKIQDETNLGEKASGARSTRRQKTLTRNATKISKAEDEEVTTHKQDQPGGDKYNSSALLRGSIGNMSAMTAVITELDQPQNFSRLTHNQGRAQRNNMMIHAETEEVDISGINIDGSYQSLGDGNPKRFGSVLEQNAPHRLGGLEASPMQVDPLALGSSAGVGEIVDGQSEKGQDSVGSVRRNRLEKMQHALKGTEQAEGINIQEESKVEEDDEVEDF